MHLKNGGKFKNLQKTIKASKEWNNLPIVVVDVDKCIEKQIDKTNQLCEDYNINPNKETLKKIWTEIHKISCSYFSWVEE